MVSFPTMQAFAGVPLPDDTFIIFDGDLLVDPFGNTGNTTFSGQFDFVPDPAYVPLSPILEPINGTIFISRDRGSFRVLEDPIKYTDSSKHERAEVARAKSSIREGLMILKADKGMDSGKRESIERSIKNSMSKIYTVKSGGYRWERL